MRESVTVVTRKGQITVPVEVRRALGLEQGDKVAGFVSKEGQRQATLRPVRSAAERTFGAVKPRKRPEDFRELRELFEQGVAEEVVREAPPTSQGTA